MELKDTVEGMLSPDYRERFKAEYWQAAIRAEKLEAMLERHDAGTLDFELSCPADLLRSQLDAMHDYMALMEKRALYEFEGELVPFSEGEFYDVPW